MSTDELGLAKFAQQVLGPNPQVLVFGHEQAKLAGEVQVGLVVRRCRQQDALAVVLSNVFLDRPVTLSFTVPQVVALIDDHEPIAAHVLELCDCAADGQHAGAHTVLLTVILPHWDEVLGTNNECFQAVIVLEHTRQGGRHERLAQPDDISNHDTAALVQVMRSDFHSRCLKIE